MRHKIAKIAREYFYDNDFIEIETPMMIKKLMVGGIAGIIGTSIVYPLDMVKTRLQVDVCRVFDT